tara:strand:+ start:5076 stop:8639 length:3564 start_codon:yes stop_codon:yes gene_type:complete
MTTLFNNIQTYRLQRDNATDTNNNNNTGDNNFWVKIRKNKNELSKVELISRVFYNNSNVIQGISGFHLFDNIPMNSSKPWTITPNKTTYSSIYKDLSDNDNILILDFEDLESRNYLNDGDDSLPILKYLVIRLTETEEVSIDNITIGIYNGKYHNYKFTGDIIGPADFLEFNTNYCLKTTTIYQNISAIGYEPGDITNTNIFPFQSLNLYYPLNWCSIDNVEINKYTDLNLNIKITPLYKTDDGINLSGTAVTENFITTKTSSIYNDYTPVSSFYNDGIYVLNKLFWCSLHSKRHLKLLLASTKNASALIFFPLEQNTYTGETNQGQYRYIQNFIYENITDSSSNIHFGNKGGGYRKTKGKIELVRETDIPYYHESTNTNTYNSFQYGISNTQYYGLNNSSTIWPMRVSSGSTPTSNYFEIRFKPLVQLKYYDGTSSLSSGQITISYDFKYDETRRTYTNSVVTFERYNGMSGTPTPAGNSYKNADRLNDNITLTWSGNSIDEQSIILLDVASGYSIHYATMSVSNTNLYDDIITNQSDYDIEAYVYQITLKDSINEKNYKYFNTAIKSFSETNTSDFVTKNREFKINILPSLDNTTINTSIFNYNDDVTGVSFDGQNPDRTNPLDDTSIFNVNLQLEKVNLENYNTTGISGFENATNVTSNVNNINILSDNQIYLSNNNFSSSSGITSSQPIITIDISNNSIDNIGLGKGLVNNLENTTTAFDTTLFLFLLKQHFLTNYWTFNRQLLELSQLSSPILDSRIRNYDIQKKVVSSIHVIDLSISGQVFLINTALGNNNISYIRKVTSETIDSTVILQNPTLDFNKIDNIYPEIDNSNPIYLNLTRKTSINNTIFPVDRSSYPVAINSSYTLSTGNEINIPLYPTNNIIDLISIFSNTGDVDKTQSTVINPTAMNGIYYFDTTVGPSSNSKLVNYHLFPGTIMLNLVELPDIDKSTSVVELSKDNRKITISWPKYYYDPSQGEITWSIVRKDIASSASVTRNYTINSPELSIIGDNIVFIDTEIRIYDKYQYTISGFFNFSSTLNINNLSKNYSLFLPINGFTTDIIFVCYGYTRRFAYGRFNTTTTNLKLFVPKVLRTDIDETTKNFFSSQLLLTNPTPPGYTDEQHLQNITTWPGGRGACRGINGSIETIGRTLVQTNENIYSNTSNQLSKKQIYNLLSKSRFRPDR